MKKNLLFTAALSIASLSAFAQPEKGNTFIGLGITNFAPQPIRLNDFTLNRKFFVPKAGHFITDNIAVGASLFASGSILDDYSYSYNVGLRPFVRYYFTGNKQKEHKRAFWFIEANAGVNRNEYRSDNYNNRYLAFDNYINYGLAVGVNYFITPNISIEALLRVDAYQSTRVGPNYSHSNFSIEPMGEIGVNFNLSGRKKARNKE